MKTLLLDFGNSYLKWSFLDGENVSNQQSAFHQNSSVLDVLSKILEANKAECDSIVMVSVLGQKFNELIERTAETAGFDCFNVTSQEELAGIKSAYIHPQKLGADRLVGMIAAYALVNQHESKPQACIVIDSGTATTIDAVDERGQHHGGVIFPGLNLSSQSLLKNTELLAVFNDNKEKIKPAVMSVETTQAIASGCLLALAGGIDSICNKMEQELQMLSNIDLSVKRVICGGGAYELLPYLELEYEHHDNLLMLGLKKIREDTVK